jgi:4-amino-4-deoxy-L-arabinose transferase-like glycosyltransferase
MARPATITWNSPPVIAAGLLAIMAVNLLTVVARKSITIDETLAIPAGYYYLTAGAFDIHSDHPPLPKMLAALPLLFVPMTTPALGGLGAEPSQLETLVATTRFWASNRDHFRTIFFWARVPMIVLTLLLGVLVFIITRRLFSDGAAVLAVTLFSLEPTMLAHGRVIKDVPVALSYLLFFFALYVYVSPPTLRRAALLGLACGLAVVMKYSMLIVLPVLLLAGGALILLAPGRAARRQIAFQVAIAVFVTGLTLNAAYFFSRQPLSAPDLQSVASTAPAVARALTPSSLLSAIAPPYFWLGAPSMAWSSSIFSLHRGRRWRRRAMSRSAPVS